MFQSKVSKCAVLLGILLVLSISASPASGVLLIPDDNITVRCTTFIEGVGIGYTPGEVFVSFRGNLVSENSVENLTLVIPSRLKKFDISSIEIISLPYAGREVRIEQLESEVLYENLYYLHKFLLLFSPPFTEIEIIINYYTIVAQWSDEDRMYLNMPIWSPKIILEKYGSVAVSGPQRDEFRLSHATTTIGSIIPEYSDYYRNFSFTLESSQMVDYQYKYFWMSTYYTPALLSPKTMWDQYQKIEEMYQRTNQLLQEMNQIIEQNERNIDTTIKVGILSVIATGIITAILTAYFTPRIMQKMRKRKKKMAKVGSLPKMK